MRLVRFLFCYVLLSVSGVVLVLFMAQNWGAIQVTFFGLDYSIHLAWLLAGAAVFGALITLVFLLPGRLAAMLHRWSLERELRQWEQDLWKLQEQYGRLLNRHERLLDAHERVLQAHHRLVGEHSQVAAQRDEIRAQLAQVTQVTQVTQVAASRTSAAHQPVRVPSLPHVAVVSSSSPGSGSPVSPGERTVMPAASVSRSRVHDVPGARRSISAPRWAVPCPPGRSAPTQAPAARVSGAFLQRTAADHVADDVSDIPPAAPAPPAPPAAPQSVAMEQPVEQPLEPAPVLAPLPTVAAPTPLLSAPRTVPLLSPEPVASAPSGTPAAPPAPVDPAAPVAFPVVLLRSLQLTADRTIAFVAPRLAEVRSWLRTTLAGMVTALAAQRVLLEARLAPLKRSILQGGLPLESDASRTSSAPIELPGGDDTRT